MFERNLISVEPLSATSGRFVPRAATANRCSVVELLITCPRIPQEPRDRVLHGPTSTRDILRHATRLQFLRPTTRSNCLEFLTVARHSIRGIFPGPCRKLRPKICLGTFEELKWQTMYPSAKEAKHRYLPMYARIKENYVAVTFKL